MKKVLLVFEDYNEMTRVQTYLRKVSFDVIIIGNELLMNDQLLSFNPDLIVACGKTQKVSSLSIGQKLRENTKYQGRVILVLPAGVRPTPQDVAKLRVDLIMESPLQPMRLIHAIAKLLDLDHQALLEKYSKAQLSETSKVETFNVTGGDGGPQSIRVGGGESAAKSGPGILITDKSRVKKYDRYTDGITIDKKETSHSKNNIRDVQKNLKKGWNFDVLDELDKLKKQFVSALFRKNG